MAEATSGGGSRGKNVHTFIRDFIEKDNFDREQRNLFTVEKEENVVKFDVPGYENKEQKFIHGHIFEDCIRQAAKNILPRKKLLKEFRTLYEDFSSDCVKFGRYLAGMINAGSVAWQVMRDMVGCQSYDLGKEITNDKYSALSSTLWADYIQSSQTCICDFKFSSQSRDDFEKTFLINGLFQVLIYCLCMGYRPENAKLGVLVFYSKENEVVYYKSELQHDSDIVDSLTKAMKVSNQASDSDSDSDSDSISDVTSGMENTSISQEHNSKKV